MGEFVPLDYRNNTNNTHTQSAHTQLVASIRAIKAMQARIEHLERQLDASVAIPPATEAPGHEGGETFMLLLAIFFPLVMAFAILRVNALAAIAFSVV